MTRTGFFVYSASGGSAASEAQNMYEKTISKKTVFEGRILSLDVLDVELADGRTGTREIIRHGAAVAVVARRRDGRFVFIRQFRKATVLGRN
jgi:ADP-ribose pyrophosphatase